MIATYLTVITSHGYYSISIWLPRILSIIKCYAESDKRDRTKYNSEEHKKYEYDTSDQ